MISLCLTLTNYAVVPKFIFVLAINTWFQPSGYSIQRNRLDFYLIFPSFVSDTLGDFCQFVDCPFDANTSTFSPSVFSVSLKNRNRKNVVASCLVTFKYFRYQFRRFSIFRVFYVNGIHFYANINGEDQYCLVLHFLL